MSARDELFHLIAGVSNDGTRPWCDETRSILDTYRAEILAEAKNETVAWLVKKAAEGCNIADLASKVDRGAVRAFLGTGHYRDAMDAHRAQVLTEAADFVGNDDTCDCGGCDSCVPNKLAAGLLAMAGEKATAAATTATPDFYQADRTYQRRRWLFQCLAVAPSPFNGETRAIGFLYRPGEPATATGLDPDDWEHGGWVEVTEGEATA